MRVIFLPAARLEVVDAQDWYEAEATGLGARFRAELKIQTARIGSNPMQFPVILADVRRARLRKFPYSLYFQIGDDLVNVVACFHSRRDPSIWQGRTA